jgi:hypothetical protein
MARYNIVSIDNGNIGQGGSRHDRGKFESAEAAIGHAKHLVDGALLEHFRDASSAHHAQRQRSANDLWRTACRIPRISRCEREGERDVRERVGLTRGSALPPVKALGSASVNTMAASVSSETPRRSRRPKAPPMTSSVVRLRAGPPSRRHPTLTEMRRGCACACFGMRRVSTPSFRLASMRLASSSRLSAKLRR